jgi:CCR4-NOT complex subunit CAF16
MKLPVVWMSVSEKILLKWLVNESNVRKAIILYATHIFDGLDNWATNLVYLTNEGTCGWQGKIEEL